MKTTLLLGMMSLVSADVCTDPATTREQYIENLCCDRPCTSGGSGGTSGTTAVGGVCTANSECVSSDCRSKCCDFTHYGSNNNCEVCSDTGGCELCATGYTVVTDRLDPAANGDFQDFGTAILGEDAGDESGHAVAFDSAGRVLAISARLNDGTAGTDSGHVRVYQWSDTLNEWERRGQDIDGLVADKKFGDSIDLNEDGTVLAVSVTEHDKTGASEAGAVRIYDWTGTAWQQRGTDIEGSAAYEHLGEDISLSSDGNTIAIGVPDKSAGKGQVLIYEWSSNAWQQIKMFEGIDNEEHIGYKVSLSGDGTKVAYATDVNRRGNPGQLSEILSVETLVNGVWVLKYMDYTGQSAKITSLDMSKDGSAVVVGFGEETTSGVQKRGNVEVYDLSDSGGSGDFLDPIGNGANFQTFLTNNDPAQLGSSVSINSDGTSVAVGAKAADSDTGRVAVYDLDGSTWELRADFSGIDPGDAIGHEVALSSSGFEFSYSSIEVLSKKGEVVAKEFLADVCKPN